CRPAGVMMLPDKTHWQRDNWRGPPRFVFKPRRDGLLKLAVGSLAKANRRVEIPEVIGDLRPLRSKPLAPPLIHQRKQCFESVERLAGGGVLFGFDLQRKQLGADASAFDLL